MSTAQQQAVAKEATTHKVLGRLPVGWKAVRMGDVVEKVGSGITPRGGEKVYRKEGVPFVRSQNIGWGELLLHDLSYVAPELHAEMRSTELQMNDVLLNISGASIGRAGLVDDRLVGGNVNQHVCIIRTQRGKLDPMYLMMFLLSHKGQKQIDSFQAGGNREGLNYDQIRSFWIPLPPLPEQQRIARILGTWDKAIGLLQEQIAAKELRLRGLIDKLVSGQRHGAKDGKLPKGWRWVRLGEVFEFRNGYNTSKEFYGAGVPFVNVLDVITHRKLTPARIKGKVRIPDAAWAVNDVRSGDLLFNRTSELTEEVGLGSVYVGNDVVTFGGFVIRGRPLRPVFDNDFLAYAIRHAGLRRQITSMGSGAIRSNIGQSDLMNVRMILPSNEDQRSIGRSLTVMDDEINHMRSQYEQLHQQKKGLMQELLSGRNTMKS